MSSKRKKNDSSDEESDRINWQKVYQKEKKKLKEADEKLGTKWEELEEMAEKNGKLERQLKHVNKTLLRSRSMLSARGVIEWLEREQRMLDSVRRPMEMDFR